MLRTLRTLQSAGATDRRPILTEVVETLKLAVPLALTQLGQIAMFTTDLALIGRLGDTYLAAGALAHTVLFATFLLGMGLVSAVAPLTAQAVGAGDDRLVRRSLRVGIHAALALAVPTIALVQIYSEPMLVALGQVPAVAKDAAVYLSSLIWAVVPGWVFLAMRGYISAVGSAQPTLWITVAAIPLNLALAYVLIFGGFGIPALGLVGAGLATTIVNTGTCLAALWVVTRWHTYARYEPLVRFWRPDWAHFAKLMIVGLPIAAAMSLEHGLFTASNLMAGGFGVPQLAAHQIALQFAAIAFMIPLGIGMAASVRVGLAFGAGNPASARRAGFVALGLGVIVTVATMIATIAASSIVPMFFLGAETEANRATFQLASALMIFAAAFFIVDGLQTVAAGALRGFNDTAVPMLLAAFSFWGIGFPASWYLTYTLDFGVRGIWIGLLIALACYAASLIWRFELMSRAPSDRVGL
ncbi:MAG: MATE family efflux transporter [Pseudomonadota bacterium]